jgi:glycine/D-amino acid oxidase-like deaminating enzyme
MMDLRTGSAFWPTRDGLIRTYPALSSSTATQVAILGAGITGALVAHALTEAGINVVVIDARDVGLGSSAASTGLLQYATDTSLHELADIVGKDDAVRAFRTGVDAVDALECLVARLGERCGFTRRPSLYLASSERDVPSLREEFALRSAHGFDVEWWDQTELRARSSLTSPAAIWSRGDGEVDCYQLVHAALSAAVRAGARVFDRTLVTSVTRHADGITLGTSTGHELRAGRLVVATGYEAAEDLHRKTGELSSTWAFVSEPVDAFPGWPERCLIWETARPYLYLRTTDDGRVLAGGEDARWSKRHASPSELHRRTDRLAGRVREMFPLIACDIAYRWAGVFATTHDGLPFIGAVPERPATSFAMGYGGNGITFSMVAAQVLREACCGREHPSARLFAFDRPSARWRSRWFGRGSS